MKSPQRKSFLNERMTIYQKKPTVFFDEVTHFDPDEWQKNVSLDIASSPRVSVRSGQGVGKTCLEANLIIWFLSCFENARVVATAPTAQQLSDVLWSEVRKWIDRSELASALLVWTKTHVAMRGCESRWFAVAKTASKPENMQGFHEDNMLFIIDEASGVSDEVLEPVFGTLTGANNKLLMCGNPTRTTGAFYDSHNRDRALYKCHKVNSLYSKRTNKQSIETLIRKYGEESNVVKVRVLGDFPTQEDDVFIPLPLVEQTIINEIEIEKIDRISIGVDVARYGDDETIIATNVGGMIKLPVIRHGQNLMATVGDIVIQYRKLVKDYPQYKGVITCNIDDTGLGGGVTDRLEEVKVEERLRRLEIVPVNFGKNPPQDGSEEHYGDIATYMWATVKDKMESRAISIPNDEELVAQLSVRKYHISSNGRLQLESKKEMKARGIKSPDRGDAVGLSCFSQNKVYNGFIDHAETVIIPAEAVRAMQIIQVNIGISIGSSVSGTSMVATAIMANHKKVVVLASKTFMGEVETDALGKEFSDFCRDIQKKHNKLDYAYCDSKERFLFKCIRDSADKFNIPITVRTAADDDVNNRIRLTTRLLAQNRLFLTEECETLARAFTTATWSEKSANDSRSASSETGTLNAFEYTIEREAARFI